MRSSTLHDGIGSQIVRHLTQADAPLETAEIVHNLAAKMKTTRSVIFKRLTDLRGDLAIRGKRVGSGKGVWIWWSLDLFTAPSGAIRPTTQRVTAATASAVRQSHSPLETTEVAQFVRDEIPATRSILLKRLHELRGDEAIRGKQVGSGKGTWIWWRSHE